MDRVGEKIWMNVILLLMIRFGIDLKQKEFFRVFLVEDVLQILIFVELYGDESCMC